ncbi:hypothetical protein [Paenibacillus sp. B1-33]|uniref:hypothetical protein n=1 Tax=unclassified Paenibacillus TaxID=185978 RepID=UPI003D2C9C98
MTHLINNVLDRSQYAPYWYIDNDTESIMEIKNHLAKPLTIIPLLNIEYGKTIQLHAITINPFATTRLDLKSELKSEISQKTEEGTENEHWGDGSRPNSLLGSAVLIPVDPPEAKVKSYGAWILTLNPKEKLGFNTMFENPTEPLIPTKLKTLWWLPHPGTKAYFSLQNTSPAPCEIQVEMVSGDTKKVVNLKLEAMASPMIEVEKLFGSENLPRMGGITVSSNGCPHLQNLTITSGLKSPIIVGRSKLINKERGFATSLMFHQSLNKAANSSEYPTPSRGTELHAPVAYFGKLDVLLERSTFFMHPHLLMWNTASFDINVTVIVYGKDIHGKQTSLELKPMTLRSNSTIDIDLQEQRQLYQSQLADGIAGIRVLHDGFTTDIVTELTNIDEKGRFAWHDDIRYLHLHQTTQQMPISFNLSPGHRSFLILKNVTDHPQLPRILLHYYGGKKQYDIDVSEVQPQQNIVVDIKRLRDEKIPDRNNEILPDDVQYGGASIFHEAGAFVISDPTFFFSPRRNVEKIANEAGPQVGDYDDNPYTITSCVKPPGRGDEPPIQPKIRWVRLWLNAFIPRDIPGITVPVPNHPGNLTMLVPKNYGGIDALIPDCYTTDQRSFNDNPLASSAMHSEITIDVSGEVPIPRFEIHNTHCTYRLECSSGYEICNGQSPTYDMHFKNLRTIIPNIFEIDLEASAKDPCIPEAPLDIGSVDIRGTIRIDAREKRSGSVTVSFNGLIEPFPAFEMYAVANATVTQNVFVRPPIGPTSSLIGGPNIIVQESVTLTSF